MVETSEPGKSVECPSFERPFGVVGHTYQPHRELFLPASGGRLSIVTGINEIIRSQVYNPLFESGESLPRGLIFSFYPGLRDWFKGVHPREFQRIVEKVNALPDKEHQVLGDTYIHSILPLQPREDQDMLIRIGRKAFEEDFGFLPKGLWLPETAVSNATLEAASDNGYQFVVLRDSQLRRSDVNPIHVRTPNGRDIGVIHFNSEKSGSLSFDEGTSLNADSFLEGLSGLNSKTVVVGSDTELYGHWKKDRDKFLDYLERPGVLEKHGFVPFNVKSALSQMDGQVTGIWDNTSWSCEHSLGRWTGECADDGANERARYDKQRLYKSLSEYGMKINERLDDLNPNWRDAYMDFFFRIRGKMFSPGKAVPLVKGEDKLFWAKTCELAGRTSCGWFFGGEGSPEREIPRAMIGEIEKLVPDISEHIVFQKAA